jgi:hypothetical protein
MINLKNYLKKIIHPVLIYPLLNIYRFVKYLFTSHSSNFHDLKFLHNLWLQNRRNSSNLKIDFIKKNNFLSNDFTPKDKFFSHEFSINSQHGEDGVTAYIFSIIKSPNKTFLEIGAGGKTSNTECLLTNFGWKGALVDGSSEELKTTTDRFFKSGIQEKNIQTIVSWITKDNVNNLINDKLFTYNIDLLSIDIDGNDLWIWDGISSIKPRLVIIEYNASLGKKHSLVMKYNEKHNKKDHHPLGWYHGASLAALSKLGKTKGYSLVYCESSGVNAFFVRNDLLTNELKEMPIEIAYNFDKSRNQIMSQEDQFKQLSLFKFETY